MSVFEIVNVENTVGFEVDPFENFVGAGDRLVYLIGPHDGLKVFVESDRSVEIPDGLKSVDEPHHVRQPVRCVELVRAAVHQDVLEAVRVQVLVPVGLQDPVSTERAID